MSKIKEFTSDFQYKGSIITDLKIENGLIEIGDCADLQTDAKVSVSGQDPDDENPERLGRVQLELEGKMPGEGTEEVLFAYRMVICADFSAPASMDRERFVKMLWMNGTSITYGIARAKLETISTMVLNRGKIALPMVNVVELLKDQLSEQSKQNDESTEDEQQ